ncbi:MAG: TolC family protein [Nitrospiraceae bacterium]
MGIPQEPSPTPIDTTIDDLPSCTECRAGVETAELAVQQGEQSRALARRQYYPDFNVAFQRFQNFQANDGFSGAYVAMTIPFAFWTKPKYDAGVQEATASVAAARAQRHTLEN